MSHLNRQQVFPEAELPDAAALIAEGRSMAKEVTVGRSPFLEKYEVPCEIAYKKKCTEEGRVMMHADRLPRSG